MHKSQHRPKSTSRHTPRRSKLCSLAQEPTQNQRHHCTHTTNQSKTYVNCTKTNTHLRSSLFHTHTTNQSKLMPIVQKPTHTSKVTFISYTYHQANENRVHWYKNQHIPKVILMLYTYHQSIENFVYLNKNQPISKFNFLHIPLIS